MRVLQCWREPTVGADFVSHSDCLVLSDRLNVRKFIEEFDCGGLTVQAGRGSVTDDCLISAQSLIV